MRKGRGILTDIKGKKGIVLTPRGEFIKVNVPNGADIGSEIEFSNNFSLLPLVAGFILILFISFTLLNNTTNPVAAAYMYLEIDSGIQLGLDENLNVISIETIDESENDFVKNLNVKGVPADKAVEVIMDEAINKRIISDNISDTTDKLTEKEMIVATLTKTNPDVAIDEEKIREWVTNNLTKHHIVSDILIQIASQEDLDSAKMQKLTPARYIMLKKIEECGLALDREKEELLQASIKDLVKIVNEISQNDTEIKHNTQSSFRHNQNQDDKESQQKNNNNTKFEDNILVPGIILEKIKDNISNNYNDKDKVRLIDEGHKNQEKQEGWGNRSKDNLDNRKDKDSNKDNPDIHKKEGNTDNDRRSHDDIKALGNDSNKVKSSNSNADNRDNDQDKKQGWDNKAYFDVQQDDKNNKSKNNDYDRNPNDSIKEHWNSGKNDKNSPNDRDNKNTKSDNDRRTNDKQNYPENKRKNSNNDDNKRTDVKQEKQVYKKDLQQFIMDLFKR
jgi:hypothetical protein